MASSNDNGLNMVQFVRLAQCIGIVDQLIVDACIAQKRGEHLYDAIAKYGKAHIEKSIGLLSRMTEELGDLIVNRDEGYELDDDCNAMIQRLMDIAEQL